MTGVRLVSVGLQLMAFWLILMAIQGASAVISVQDTMHVEGSARWWAVMPAAIFLSFAAILWFFSTLIAKKLYPAERTGADVQFSPEMVLRVGCCLLGLWTFCTALPSAGRLAALAILRAGLSEFPIPQDLQLHVVFLLLQFGFALFLVFGNRTIYSHTLGRP